MMISRDTKQPVSFRIISVGTLRILSLWCFRAGLMHIHLCLPPNKFPEKLPQPDRVCKKGDPDNDACLVYVQGELYENKYSLIAIMYPDAHEKARKHDVMSYLARIAQNYKDEN